VILIDSDVLIWLTRGQQNAKARLSEINPWRISAITYMELAQGCRSKEELHRAKRGLERKDTEIVPLTTCHEPRPTNHVLLRTTYNEPRTTGRTPRATSHEPRSTINDQRTTVFNTNHQLPVTAFGTNH